MAYRAAFQGGARGGRRLYLPQGACNKHHAGMHTRVLTRHKPSGWLVCLGRLQLPAHFALLLHLAHRSPAQFPGMSLTSGQRKESD